jgi:hypothetical protein
MRLDLFVREGRFKLRHQIARTYHVLAQATNQIQRAAIYQRDGENKIVREYCMAMSR